MLAGAVLLSLSSVSNSFAASIYDGAYSTTDTLWLGEDNFYGINCTYANVTNSLEDILANSSNWQSPTNYTNWWPDFNEAKNHGSWAVSQNRLQMGGGESRQIWIAYTTSPGDVTWPEAHTVRASGTSMVHLWITTKQQYYGYGGCNPLVLSYSATIMDISREGSWYAPQSVENYLAVGWNIEYPDINYEGAPIYEGPPKTSYTGTVDCGGDDPSYVVINQPWNSGAAVMTPTSPGRASWSYNLTDAPYSITVGCGDLTATSFSSVSPLPPTSNDWVCNMIDDPHYCVLS